MDPNTEQGTEITTQMATMAITVPKGMAPEDPALIKKKFNPMKQPKIIPGINNGVNNMFNLQSSPPKNL
ncbi:hypothetical protein WICPIJ_005174 [Wickerhamomyces pijperi]|uniref:Uncharacterized protein n=1 Tax=Wickerhamomyces pijperi TaxID=599730 RepID=A0A9P8Q4K3_WICPI|nr:hypothetical protein WICPIJ_005174 [Wickerhamomyces pijperi]